MESAGAVASEANNAFLRPRTGVLSENGDKLLENIGNFLDRRGQIVYTDILQKGGQRLLAGWISNECLVSIGFGASTLGGV